MKPRLRIVAPATVNRTVTPRRRPNAELRTREYLTETEVGKLIKAAGKNRWGHRDATMILVGYRHGLRVSELVDLRWDQIDFGRATLAVRRVKGGTPATHPIRGDELRALRRLQREQAPSSPFVFVSERASPFTAAGFAKLVERAGEAARLGFPAHPHMLRHACGFALASKGHDTRALQAYLGHKNIQHTVRYTELSPDRFKNFWGADIPKRLEVAAAIEAPQVSLARQPRTFYSRAKLQRCGREGTMTTQPTTDIRPIELAHIEDDELIENLARFADGTLSEAAVKSRHHLSNEGWAALGESDKLVELVEACKLRRIRSGATKREKAQIEIVDAPPILGKIMRDPDANARHIIDSVKTLDALASTGAEAAAAGARFEITINLGADHSEHYSKSIAIDANDTDPNDLSTTTIAAIAMNKSKDDGGGQGHL